MTIRSFVKFTNGREKLIEIIKYRAKCEYCSRHFYRTKNPHSKALNMGI